MLSAEVLDYYGKEITRQVLELNKAGPAAGATHHLRQGVPADHESLAAERRGAGVRLRQAPGPDRHRLLQTPGVRMYHDQALYKEAGGGYTPWHVDQFYWPLDDGQNRHRVDSAARRAAREWAADVLASGASASSSAATWRSATRAKKKSEQALKLPDLPWTRRRSTWAK